MRGTITRGKKKKKKKKREDKIRKRGLVCEKRLDKRKDKKKIRQIRKRNEASRKRHKIANKPNITV